MIDIRYTAPLFLIGHSIVKMLANSVVVLDFETTGLSPMQGDRAIEIGAVKIVDGQCVDTYQQLMYPGRRVSSFIEQYTGINNQMLANAAPCSVVMDEFADFIGGCNLVAHNASFDKRFLDAEFDRIGRSYTGEFACSLLLARRLYQTIPSHKLGALVDYKQIATDGVFHRALADAQMTADLWLAMLADIEQDYQRNMPTFKLIQKLCKTPKAGISKLLSAR